MNNSMDIPQTPTKIKLMSTKQVIALATELDLWVDNPEMNQSIPAQRLKTRLKKFADRIQQLTAEQLVHSCLTAEKLEDRIPDID